MICLCDGTNITVKEIVSKDDKKLENFILENGKSDIKNLEFIKSSNDKFSNKETMWTHDGLYQKIEDSSYVNEFKFKKLTTLKIVKSALENSKIKIPNGISTFTGVINFIDFFKNYENDLLLIESIQENPYFYELLEKISSDYNAFLEIFPFIEFETKDEYTLEEFRRTYNDFIFDYRQHPINCDNEIKKKLYLDKINESLNTSPKLSPAKNNHCILNYTKALVKDLNKRNNNN